MLLGRVVGVFLRVALVPVREMRVVGCRFMITF